MLYIGGASSCHPFTAVDRDLSVSLSPVCVISQPRCSLNVQLLHAMAPKPASTGGKAPAAGAAKTPAKTTEGAKAPKKSSKTATAPTAAAGEEKKKRKKSRKESYSSYIYRGVCFKISDSGPY